MVAVAFLVPLMLLSRELAADRAVGAAEQEAETAARLLSPSSSNDPEADFGRIGFESLSLIQPDGEVLGVPVPADEDLSTARAGAAGSRRVDGGIAVYVPVADTSGDFYVIRRFVSDAELTRNVGRSWMILGGLAIVLVGMAVAVANVLGRSMVEPVRELSRAASRLGEGRLDTRVRPSGPPELEMVAAEFNHLADRVSELLQQERETAADLSHRLRTPLTAARLNAESLPSGPRREQLLGDLAELERTADYIIDEARRPIRAQGRLTDLAAAVAERAAFWEPLAEEQGRTTDLVCGTDGPLWCEIDPEDFAAAVDALIGNIFSHTSEGVQYRITVESHTGSGAIHIDDAGPGVSDPTVLGRGHSGAGSTGLGLDIVRRTAETAGGSIRTTVAPLGGARITMELPLVEGR
jgi:signal transduction histidine kinase